jgi:hypothetical protein
MVDPVHQWAACRCGKARVEVRARPVLRAYCHCLICQAFNGADRADVSVFHASDARIEDEKTVEFRVYQQPPLVQRGQCTSCGGPAVERIRIPLFPALTVVPSGNFADPAFLPAPALHIFYHRRKADAADDLPKYSGFLSSQNHFMLALVKGLFRRSRASAAPG